MSHSPNSSPVRVWSTALLTGLTGLSSLGAVAPALAQTSSPTPTPSASETTAPAPEKPPVALETVEIRGSRSSDTTQRQQSTAAKTVIGREELDRMGDATVSEVLKRLPGVTIGGRPGRGGEVRMRGLGGGYTQILINGERMPMGMSLDNLTPEQIERIEIIRGPTAETGAQAIAGTINVVLREDVRKRLNNVQLRLNHDDGRWQPSVNWTRADQIDAFSYNLSANLSRSHSNDTTEVRTRTTVLDGSNNGSGTPTLDQQRNTVEHSDRTGLHMGGRLQWRLGPGESFALMPFFVDSRGTGNSQEHTSVTVGTPDYLNATQHSRSHFSMGRLNAQWQTRLEGGQRLELKAGGTLSRHTSSSVRQEIGRPSGDREVDDQRSSRDNWLSTSGKVTQSVADGEHQLSMGWELERGSRHEDRQTWQTTASGISALGAESGDVLQATTLRQAYWAQDEWLLTPQWSLQGGVRWESIDTRSDSTESAVHNRNSVLTPLFHAVWRPNPGGQDQVRLALTRSWRAPTLGNLIARRTESTGTHLEINPDQAGNPDLRPELATGLDLAYEHYLGEGSVMSVGIFERHISQLIRRQTALETLNGSQRWVSRPQNVGDAVTRGLELEAKFKLSQWWDQAPPIEVRSNLSVFRSQVKSLPGPDNRLDKQPHWSGSLGADWRLRGLPFTLGASLTHTPAYAIQLSSQQLNTLDTRHVLDAYALWAVSSTSQFRLTVSNWQPRQNLSTSTLTTTTTQQGVQTQEHSHTSWALRWELKI